jgi:cobalt-zinc-cadmium efflux system membrane fusion protein
MENPEQPETLESERQSENASAAIRRRRFMMVGSIALTVAVLAAGIIWWSRGGKPAPNRAASMEEGGEHADEHQNEVMLSPEALVAAKIEVEGVTQRPSIARLKVTGTVETNPQQTQQVTPLVSGRVERVNVVLGDRVSPGTVLAVISSPQIAQMHGKLHEAETQLSLTERNLTRVLKAENRVAVLQSKAKLNEAEATLKRTRRLIELGAGAGKDLIAAETAYQTAKADYDFQTNISLNREVQEAQAAVETARVDVGHLRDEMRALGAPVRENELKDHKNDSSLIRLLAPASGRVTERLANPGAGIEAGKPLFTIANISTMWVIANVPEGQLGSLREGTPAEIRSSITGGDPINGRVAYIDPQLSEDTRSGRVRIEVPNPGERLKAGMFVEVGFQTSTNSAVGEELVVPTAAIQRVGERTIVFIPKDEEAGGFEVREVEVGGETDGYTRILSGLKIGEKVVTKGSFTLKTQLEKGAMGDEH